MACTYEIGCSDSLNLGYFGYCEELLLSPMLAKQTGTHIIKYNNRGHNFSITFEATLGNAFVIPNRFNENSEICFTVVQPDQVLYTQTGTGESKFYLKVVPTYEITEDTTC